MTALDSLKRKRVQNSAENRTITQQAAEQPRKRRWVRKLLWLLAIIIAIVVLVNLLTSGKMPFLTSNDYYAVFLTNGQVYFGKLRRLHTRLPKMYDVYYLGNNQILGGTRTETPSNVSLVRLGSELHRPKNWIILNRDHILLVEKLSPNSPVLTAIRNFQKQ